MGTVSYGTVQPGSVASVWHSWNSPRWRPGWGWASEHECLGREDTLKGFPRREKGISRVLETEVHLCKIEGFRVLKLRFIVGNDTTKMSN